MANPRMPFNMMFSTLILSFLLLTVPAKAFARRADSSTFSLYAYGHGIGGFPVFAVGGKTSEIGLCRYDELTVFRCCIHRKPEPCGRLNSCLL